MKMKHLFYLLISLLAAVVVSYSAHHVLWSYHETSQAKYGLPGHTYRLLLNSPAEFSTKEIKAHQAEIATLLAEKGILVMSHADSPALFVYDPQGAYASFALVEGDWAAFTQQEEGAHAYLALQHSYFANLAQESAGKVQFGTQTINISGLYDQAHPLFSQNHTLIGHFFDASRLDGELTVSFDEDGTKALKNTLIQLGYEVSLSENRQAGFFTFLKVMAQRFNSLLLFGSVFALFSLYLLFRLNLHRQRKKLGTHLLFGAKFGTLFRQMAWKENLGGILGTVAGSVMAGVSYCLAMKTTTPNYALQTIFITLSNIILTQALWACALFLQVKAITRRRMDA